MGRRLNNTVHVYDADQGDYTIYGPDDDVPAKHAKLIGDHAWADSESSEWSDDPGSDAPPRAGAGSGVDKWRDFARANGVDVEDDETRESVIEKCEQAGLVEPA